MAAKKKRKKKRSDADASPPASSASSAARPSSSPSAPPPPPERSWKRYALVAIACVYLADVWLDAVGSNLPGKLLPRSVLFFGQIAALFTKAGEKQIDYRAEGWVCAEHKWVEIDPRPFFPLDADNKENRFYRAVQFYRRNRTVMRALDDYVTTHHNAARDKKIGGVRFLSLRIPYPPVGATIEPYKRQELAAYPADQRHDWYWTPGSMRRERCGERHAPPPTKDDDDDASPAKGSDRDHDRDRDREDER